jgi:hypothetical protein
MNKLNDHSFPHLRARPNQSKLFHNLTAQTTMKSLALAFLRPLLARGKPFVPLEIHIMSQCPDAADCVSQLISPALPEIANITAFTLSFIGPATDSGVTCKHGPAECDGNMLNLCGAHLSTPPKPAPVQRYWGFTECQLSDYGRMRDRGFVERCVCGGGGGGGGG